MNDRAVSTAGQLVEACAADGRGAIVVAGVVADVPSLRLPPGRAIRGAAGAALRFLPGADGLELSADNEVSGLALTTDVDRRALFLGTEHPDLGRLVLTDLDIVGCVRLIAGDGVRTGHVEARSLRLAAADARGFGERPKGFGVEVVPAAFTLWNRSPDPASRITADLRSIGAGRPGAPVRGGGIFVGGVPGGGRLYVRRLETAEVHSDGGIAAGTADRIAGGVFVVHGAVVDEVLNLEPVSTYGSNDMVLDNWGVVRDWRVDRKVTSYGPSAIGFVNFGSLETLRIEDVVETHGAGSRGFNVYDGTLREAVFDRIVTRGDGAVGVQISKHVGRIAVRRGIETFGGKGPSLVKGVVTELPATALSVKPGGSAGEITVEGGVRSHGAGIEAFELHGDVVSLRVTGGFGPQGEGFAGI